MAGTNKTFNRNQEIYDKYLGGYSKSNLAKEYKLSKERITQILKARENELKKKPVADYIRGLGYSDTRASQLAGRIIGICRRKTCNHCSAIASLCVQKPDILANTRNIGSEIISILATMRDILENPRKKTPEWMIVDWS